MALLVYEPETSQRTARQGVFMVLRHRHMDCEPQNEMVRCFSGVSTATECQVGILNQGAANFLEE